MRVLSACQPIYEELDGWKENILDAREMNELPANARRYLKRLEELAEAKIVLVSVGAGREETIMLEDPFHHLVSS